MKYKTTEKGTQLPLLNLRGKDYLQVAHRLVWFREMHPDGVITTQILEHKDEKVLVKAEIFVRFPTHPQPQLLAQAHKMESKQSFEDYVEKAETSAIGRALGICGFGTQFEPSFDEESRLADAPIDPVIKAVPAQLQEAVETGVEVTAQKAPKKMTTFRKERKADTVVAAVVMEEAAVVSEDEI